MQLKEIVHILDSKLDDPVKNGLVTNYQFDSRKVQVGDLFFALKGAKVDGHDFLQDAENKGAIAAVVLKDTIYEGKIPLIRVADTLLALQALARDKIQRENPYIIGITGSLGKTTVKDFTYDLLSDSFIVGKNPSSYNSQRGLPLTVLQQKRINELLILEMGMSEKGEIERLTSIAPPDLALITKVAVQHVEFFEEGIEGIAKAKGEILSPRTKTAIFGEGCWNFMDHYRNFAGMRYRYSSEVESDFFLKEEGKKVFVFEEGKKSPPIQLPFREKHLLENFLAACSIARIMGVSWEKIIEKAALLEPPKMRFEKFEKEGIFFINDVYNASPDSVKAAFSSMPKPKRGRKRIAVLGEMRELGKYSDFCHQEIGKEAIKAVDCLLTIGEKAIPAHEVFSKEKEGKHFSDMEDLASSLKEIMEEGDVVLVKGSRGMHLENLFPKLFLSVLEEEIE